MIQKTQKIDINLKIYNKKSKEKDTFEPIDSENIKIYVCGPTVYTEPHVGNMRSIVVYDVLFRVLRFLYKKVTYVRNITDVDDKIINKALQDADLSGSQRDSAKMKEI